MKAIICGGRGYILGPEDYGQLETLRHKLPITEVVCGEAPGADTCAKEWALGLGIPVKSFYAPWRILGRRAGAFRNSTMADYAQACIAFTGGSGTADMVRKAQRNGLIVHDLRKEK